MTAEIKARTADLEWQLVTGEVVMLDLRTSCYLSLNRSAATLWPLVVAGTSRGELVDSLTTTYGIDALAAGRDVDALVSQLSEADLLEENDDAPAHPR